MPFTPESSSEEVIRDPSENLEYLQGHLRTVYHQRSEAYLPGRTPRIELFNNGIINLNQAIRSDNQELVSIALAQLGARVFCIADAFEVVSVEAGLDAKFPEYGCLFCGQTPCVCGSVRQAPSVDWPPAANRRNWSLDNWQSFLNYIYGDKNNTLPADYSVIRLYGESGELTTLENDIVRGRLKLDEVPKAYSMATADLMAWVLATGSRFGISVQTELLDRYGNGCPTCGFGACQCGPDEFDHVYPSLD